MLSQDVEFTPVALIVRVDAALVKGVEQAVPQIGGTWAMTLVL